MSKARDLADFVSDGSPLSDGTISVSEVSGAAPTASPTFTGDATFDTDTLVVDSTNNRVGIGTSSPNRSLEVYNASAQAPIRVESGQGTAYIDFKSSGTTADFKVGLGAINDDAYFRAGGSEAMRIKSNGNVGIGETTANEKLSINGGNIRLETQPSTTRRIYALGGTQSYVLNSTGGAAIAFERDASNNDEIAFETHAQGNAHAERMRIGNYGQLGFNGANYGTSGQVLTSNGSSSAPSWQSVSFTTNVVTSNTTASANNHYYLNAATVTLTLPASPSVGDEVRISEVAGNTDCVIGRNGSNIMGDASDLTIDSAYAVVYLRYVDATIGWAFS
jgi:hypothetical protein